MRKVIMLDEPKEAEQKPVEFTHCLQFNSNRMHEIEGINPEDYISIHCIGKHGRNNEFDVFRGKGKNGSDYYFLGHLNSGMY